MTWYENTSTVILLINLFFAAIVLFWERRNVGMTWAWLMILLFIPVAGFVLYLFLGQKFSRRKLYRISRESQDVVRAIVEGQRQAFHHDQVQYADSSLASYKPLIYMNLMGGYALFTQDNEVEFYTKGEQKFAALFQAIEEAQHHIHVQYYIIEESAIGREFIERLRRKAAEGVIVRLLYDDIGSAGLSKQFYEPLVEAGGHVARFFPSLLPFLNIRVNYRNHRKIVVVDGTTAFMGGFNVGDEYLGSWRDTHMRLKGSSALQLQAHFFLDWNLASTPEQAIDEHPEYFPVVNSGGSVGVQIVSSGPNSDDYQIQNAFIAMVHAARTRICIQSPYFVPDDSVLRALKMAALSGVQIDFMIPARPDHRMVYWATMSYLGELLEVGAKVWLYNDGFMHAKTIVVDGKIASVGTANVDNRSYKLNFEIVGIIYDIEHAQQLEQIFDHDLVSCVPFTKEQFESRSSIVMFRESLIRLLSPIL